MLVLDGVVHFVVILVAEVACGYERASDWKVMVIHSLFTTTVGRKVSQYAQYVSLEVDWLQQLQDHIKVNPSQP